MTSLNTLLRRWMKDPGFRREYEALDVEFMLIAEVFKARKRSGLTRAQLARRMKTTRSAIARLESGRGRPSTTTLSRFAKATGHRLKISFEPVKKERGQGWAERSEAHQTEVNLNSALFVIGGHGAFRAFAHPTLASQPGGNRPLCETL